MRFPLRQMEAFHAVCQHGSITRAAEEMGVSQPAVSRLLIAFSGSVGFELFHKLAGRLMPTREAAFLLREVERLLETLDNIDRLSVDLTDRRAGHLRVACLSGFATSHLPGVLAAFVADRPALRVTLEPDRPERILEWIISEHYDCGISDTASTHPLVESKMIGMRTACIVPKGHVLAAKAVIWPEDMAPHNIIHTRRDSEFFRQVSAEFINRGVKLSTRFETRQFTAACMLVAAGAGVSVVSEMDAREYENRGLVIRPFGPDIVHRLALLRPTNARSSLIALEFMETFEASLAPFRHP